LSTEGRRTPGKGRWGATALLALLLWISLAGGSWAAAEGNVQRYTLGCILPLSGRHAAYGNATLDAVLLATGIFDPRRETPLRLLVEDSQSEPAQAGAAVQRLALAGAVAIIGPLGGQEALAAAQEAQRLAIPILTMTQREGITGIGEQVFRNFLTAAMQVRTIVQYARTVRGLNRFAMLYPQDDYGQEMARLFGEEVRRQGGELEREASYRADQTDFGEQIMLIGGRVPLLNVPPGEALPEVPPEALPEVTPVDPGFEALFIPDATFRVPLLVRQLADYGLAGIQLLGTSGWRSPDLVGTDPGGFEGALFADAFFTNSLRPATSDFIDAFYLAFGRVPDVMEALVYDAAGMAVRVLLQDPEGTRESFRQGLLALQGYPGATGRSSFGPTREAEKDLFILTVRDGQIIQVR
jgi:ABC-type branched-subunit amino acid transport system substrate-binding protein